MSKDNEQQILDLLCLQYDLKIEEQEVFSHQGGYYAESVFLLGVEILLALYIM